MECVLVAKFDGFWRLPFEINNTSMASISLTEEFQNRSAKNIFLMLNAVCETKKLCFFIF